MQHIREDQVRQRIGKRGSLLLMLKGSAMGMAEVVPGVSGGTIAFITGIYERLIYAITSIGTPLVGTFQDSGAPGVWREIDGRFLTFLLLGMVGGIVVGVFGVSYLLEHYPVVVWSFFFGLIISSAIYIGRKIDQWRWKEIVAISAGAVVAYVITVAVPAEGIYELWFVFIAGSIAISALILPGISGSFILLLMGMYTFIIPTVKNALQAPAWENIQVLITFGLGCLTGLALFSRILSWTLKNHYSITLAALTGFIIGSLNKIWPWRNPVLWIDPAGQYVEDIRILSEEELIHLKLLKEENVWPAAYAGEPYLIPAILSFLAGLAIVWLLAKLDK